MTNTLASPVDLAEFGSYSDTMVDVAVADLRAEAGWHIAPRISETLTIRVLGRRGGRAGYLDEIVLPTRDLPGAPVVVNAVRSGGSTLTGWSSAEGMLLRSWGFAGGALEVDVTHGFVSCPKDLLPLIAALAQSSSSARDSRVSSFTNGGVQMAFESAYMVDPKIARYRVLGGVA